MTYDGTVILRSTIYILCDLIRYYYVEKRRVQVAKHLSPQRKSITDITNSFEIEINMEKVFC